MARNSKEAGTAKTVISDKREAILRAGVRVFAAKGFFNSKVADIAREAGIADGTVYLYFKSKDEILHSIFERAMSDFIEDGRRELEPIADPVEKLKTIARLHLERLSSDRDLAVVFQVELRGSTKVMQEFSAAGFAESLDIIKAAIEDGQKSGAFRKDMKSVVCAKILYGALDEMVTNWILSANKYPLPPMAGEVLKIFLGGLLINDRD
jgi:TetR/AcrR family fatty acid metabolism transcriptional regulator